MFKMEQMKLNDKSSKPEYPDSAHKIFVADLQSQYWHNSSLIVQIIKGNENMNISGSVLLLPMAIHTSVRTKFNIIILSINIQFFNCQY